MRKVRALIGLGSIVGFCSILVLAADDNRSLGDRTRQYLTDLIKLDTSNPAGNETRVAEYLKRVADSYGIPAETLGSDPRRLNFVARLKGNGKAKPLLLMAHADVVPADAKQWTADPFSGELRNGFIYGRGSLDAKSLGAAELAVMVEIKRRNLRLNRDLILVSQADSEIGSAGIQWLIQNAWGKIDAEFGLSEGGTILETKDGAKVFEVQNSEKVPSRVLISARGTASHSSLPRPDNPLVHVSDAVSRLFKADQPIHLNATTRRYFRELSNLPEYSWLGPIWPKLEDPAKAQAAASQIRARDL
jgi:acetylornithine deacetylase/succinyl-diaminopimelate desuccinylase-like protein